MVDFIDDPLTPSELIFMNGEKFAPSSGKQRVKLLHADMEVSSPHLAHNIVAAVVLANEKLGALRLEMVEHKTFFSQKKTVELAVSVVGNLLGWPGDTLEAMIPDWTKRLGKGPLKAVLENVIGEPCEDPWLKIIDRVAWGMASSGWLLRVQGDAAKAFTTDFVCPARVRELAMQQSIVPLQQLFLECRNTRPEIWNALQEALSQAVEVRSLNQRERRGNQQQR